MTNRAPRLLYPINEACQVLGGLGRTTLYDLAKGGRIHITKVGRRSYIAETELRRFVAALDDTEATRDGAGMAVGDGSEVGALDGLGVAA